jgi:DNA-binding NtrC family response regulator
MAYTNRCPTCGDTHVCNTPAPELKDEHEIVPLKILELRHIRTALFHFNGNKTKAAKILGIGRRSLYRRLEDAKSGKISA